MQQLITHSHCVRPLLHVQQQAWVHQTRLGFCNCQHKLIVAVLHQGMELLHDPWYNKGK
jgi:hypothetical protein